MQTYTIIGIKIPCESGEWTNIKEMEAYISWANNEISRLRNKVAELSAQVPLEFDDEDG